MNQIFLGEPSEYIKNWFIQTFLSWPTYTTLKFVDGTTQTKEISGAATWQNIGVKSDQQSEDNTLTYCKLGNKVTEINDQAFIFCYSLTSVNIPNSVTSIGNEAFSGCTNLFSINIPKSVTSIGYGVFQYDSNLTSVIFEGRTMSDITSMANYPFGAATSAIVPGIS